MNAKKTLNELRAWEWRNWCYVISKLIQKEEYSSYTSGGW